MTKNQKIAGWSAFAIVIMGGGLLAIYGVDQQKKTGQPFLTFGSPRYRTKGGSGNTNIPTTEQIEAMNKGKSLEETGGRGGALRTT